jgi:crotonobetainyl-CoA:carnitine CoA-transferase CaiB-like acyl-CoA transferase
VLGDASLGTHEKFATKPKRVANRADTDALVGAVFAKHDVEPLARLLQSADIAFARVGDSELLSKHPHLRRITVDAPSGPVSMPAPAPIWAGAPRSYGAIPALGAHPEKVRWVFLSESSSCGASDRRSRASKDDSPDVAVAGPSPFEARCAASHLRVTACQSIA